MNLCQCGNHKKKTAKMCLRCWLVYLELTRLPRYDTCSCGKRKQRKSTMCAECFRDSIRTTVYDKKQTKKKSKKRELDKNKNTYCPVCGELKTDAAKTCRRCYYARTRRRLLGLRRTA